MKKDKLSKYENKVEYTILNDLKSITIYVPLLLLIVILLESIRKFTLHNLGVPIFVLDYEPIITIFSYGVVFTSISIGSLIYLILWFTRKKYILNTIFYVRKEIFLTIFGIIIFIIIGNLLSIEKKDGLIYISKDFKIIKEFDVSKVYFLNNDKTLICCKTGLINDDCFDK